MAEADGSLRELELHPGYDSGEDALGRFYIPALQRATRYARSVGYFRSSSLRVAARGLAHFIAGGGRMRLLAGTDLTEEDCEAMAGRVSVPEVLAERLASGLVASDEIAEHRLAVLAWLAHARRLVIRLAIPVDDQGAPIPGGASSPYFHEKIGVLRDDAGDGVAFQGSVNETESAWARNFESFSVYSSWREPAYFDHWSEAFDRRWAGRITGWKVVNLPQALADRLFAFLPTRPPLAHDPEEPPELGDPALVARYLLAAPTNLDAQRLAEATSAVELFPHQAKVAERLAGEYPRSWLVADEVGLGKTISAGVALRRLMLAGEVRRALILAPAGVCRQWQDELFEKFGLWVPRLEGSRWLGAHPEDETAVPAGENPYAGHETLIASSHLARRRDHQDQILAAGPWDLLVVDEAHHARRQGTADPSRYRPSRLLQLLDRVTDRAAARAVWLLTATPMQVHPIELRDLLVHVGLQGPLADWDNFEGWFSVLNEPDPSVPWAWLADQLARSGSLPVGPGERAILDDVGRRLGPVQRARIERFGQRGEDGAALAEELRDDGRRELRRWLRHWGPVGRHVTRHSRTTLRRYRDEGLLTKPLADRHVTPVVVDFSPAETRLYGELDGLIDRLQAASGTRKGAGFVITVYRRRLTSSWAAIQRTLERRLGRQRFDLDDDLLEEAEREESAELELGEAVPLSTSDVADIERWLTDIRLLDDSKFERLQRDLDEARGAGRAAIVFTQFSDTLDHLRDRLQGSYRGELATYTGSGGQIYDAAEGWQPASKQDLVVAIRDRRVGVLLATDAASEGLNLQDCSFLVNYDMPWNPMRVEQRIGRIDRIGQQWRIVEVRNYFIPGTIEERVYELLADRIDDFSDLLGNLQPILGATEDALRSVFRAPRGEREAQEQEALRQLDRQIDDLRSSGMDIDVEDPTPMPEHPPSPVTLEHLEAFSGHLRLRIGHPNRPATFDTRQVSRDPTSWRALATYGHPDLTRELERVSADHDDGALVIGHDDEAGVDVTAAVRADRTPPERVRTSAELGELGDPSSAGDAQQLADRLARSEGLLRLERKRAILRARMVNVEEGIRQRFIRLANRLITAECARSVDAGEPLSPMLVWLDLSRDATTSWGYAEAFRHALDLPVETLASPRLADPWPLSNAEVRRTTRVATETELVELMGEFRQVRDAPL